MSVKPFPRKRPWLSRCIVTPTGAPLAILHNAIEALRGDPAIQDAYAFDEMQRIRKRLHGRSVDQNEVLRRVRTYLIRHVVLDQLYRRGLLSY